MVMISKISSKPVYDYQHSKSTYRIRLLYLKNI